MIREHTPQETRISETQTPRSAVKAKAKSAPKAKGPRRFRLTERDYEILTALNAYRYLRTGQVHRLLFPECRTSQMARRRLRNLADPHYGYIRRIEPYTQAGHGSAETAWFLGRPGEEILRARGQQPRRYAPSQSPRVKHEFLAHALELSEFRVNLELALKTHPWIALERFVADFEMKEHASISLGKKAFLLYHELSLPGAPGFRAESYAFEPDAMVILQGKGRYAHLRRLFFVEIDRGTMSHSRLRRKVIGYDLFRDRKLFAKYGPFSAFRVLFQTDSGKRAKNICKTLTGLRGEDLVWVTDASRVTEASILVSPIWTDAHGTQRTILKASPSGPIPSTTTS